MINRPRLPLLMRIALWMFAVVGVAFVATAAGLVFIVALAQWMRA